MKEIALLYYDEFSEFEIVLISLIFRRHDLISVALENREYRSEERQRFCVDKVIKDTEYLLRVQNGAVVLDIAWGSGDFSFCCARTIHDSFC